MATPAGSPILPRQVSAEAESVGDKGRYGGHGWLKGDGPLLLCYLGVLLCLNL